MKSTKANDLAFSAWYNQLTGIVASNTSVSLKNLQVKMQSARSWYTEGLTPQQAFGQMEATRPGL